MLVTWASGVVSSGVIFLGPGMSLVVMRFKPVSQETPRLDRSETLVVGMNDPLDISAFIQCHRWIDSSAIGLQAELVGTVR
jgi:hypothetical protein